MSYTVECVRCGKRREYDNKYQIERKSGEHHVMRKVNDPDDTLFLCGDCHRWVHDNPLAAKKEGFYKPMDGTFKKKRKNKSKWEIHK
jgi:hypothetical protein